MRSLLLMISVTLALGLSGCGGGGGGDTAAATTPPVTVVTTANQVAITVNQGLDGAVDTPNVSVTICVPGTATCQTIPNVLVDTGSFGLRLFASSISIPLPTSTMGGGTLTNCAQFGLGTTYGSVQLADVKLAGEVGSSTPIQVIADPNFATVPSSCLSGGTLNVASPAALKSNGILGIGGEPIDCPGCETNASQSLYYICTSATSCTQTTAAASVQVANPVVKFAQDNNGTLLSLPSLSAAGSSSASGVMTFGIGTQSDNALGSATIYTTTGYVPGQLYDTFTTIFNGHSNIAFLDSGSNGIFFNDNSIAQCTNSVGFYCPASTLSFSALTQGQNGASVIQDFSIANAQTLFDNGAYAMNNIGGTYTSGIFDWGLPFFFGRAIYTAIDGKSTPGGTGPYVAF